MEHRNYTLRGTPDCPISVYHSTRLRHRVSVHPELELILLLQGNILYQMDGQTTLLTPGDILIISPNHPHNILNTSKELRFINVLFWAEAVSMPKEHIFQQSFVAPLWKGKIRLPSLLQPGHPIYQTVRSILEQLPPGFPQDDHQKIFLFSQIIGLCAALQPYTASNSQHPRQFPEDQAMRKVIMYLYLHYREPLTLEKIATCVHLHPNYLCGVFKSYAGRTVMEQLTQTRVDAAKYLLRRDSLSMPQVAELTGFPSERTFYRQFKQLTGMTPKEYQKEQVRAYAEYF